MDIFTELSYAMKLREINQEVISSNIANINTPNYRCKSIDFKEEIEKVLSNREKFKIKLWTTNPRHISGSNESSKEISPTIKECNTPCIGNDKNNVDLDREMAKLAKNQLLYNSYVQLFGKRIKMLKDTIISGGR